MSTISRVYLLIPAWVIGIAALSVDHPVSAAVLFLNHATFLWALWAIQQPSAGSAIWAAWGDRLPSQLIFQFFFGSALLILVGVPLSLLITEHSLLAALLSLSGGVAVTLTVRALWPALTASLWIAPATANIVFSPQHALHVSHQGRALAGSNANGIGVTLAALLLATMPVLLALLRAQISPTAWWIFAGLYLGIVAPAICTYVLTACRQVLASAEGAGDGEHASLVAPVAPTPDAIEPAPLPSVKQGENLTTHAAPMAAADGPAFEPRVAIASDANEDNPLHHAAVRGKQDMIEQLIQQGSDLNHVNQAGQTPLQAACGEGQWDNAALLIQRGAKVSAGAGSSALHIAASAANDDPQGIELLAKAKADVNQRGKLGRSALMEAAIRGNARCVEALLKAGAELNAQDEFGNTALMEAVRCGANPVLQRLVLWHPDTELRDKPGRTALLLAARSNKADAETIRLLLAMGANPKARNRDGHTPAELAATGNRRDVAKALGHHAPSNQPAAEATPVRGDNEPTRIDLNAFVTDEDRDWAQRQAEGRSRTQLEAATQSMPLPAATEETAASSSGTTLAGAANQSATITPRPADVSKDQPSKNPQHEDDEHRRTTLDSVVDLGPIDQSAFSDDRSGVFVAPGSQATQRDVKAGTYRQLIKAVKGQDTDAIGAILQRDRISPQQLNQALRQSIAGDLPSSAQCLLQYAQQQDQSPDSSLVPQVLNLAPPQPQFVSLLLSHRAHPWPSDALLWLSGLAEEQQAIDPSEREADDESLMQLIPRLLARGADIAATDTAGNSALHWAVRYRDCAFVDALLEAGAPVNAGNKQGDTPLLIVCTHARPAQAILMRTLVQRGADPRLANESGQTPMSVASEQADQTLIKQLMVATTENPADAAPAVQSDHQSLTEAVAKGDVAQVKRHLADGADVNERDEYGCTPLIRACGLGYTTVVATLIQSGADVELGADNGTTPLGAAVLGNHPEVVKLLHELGVDIEQAQQFGLTPSMLAAARWNSSMLKLLFKLGADVNRRDDADGTALMAAVQNALYSDKVEQADESLQLLLQAGADVDASNDEGQTALMLLLGVRAKQTGTAHPDTLLRLTQRLLKAKADLDRQDLSGWSALHAAATHGFLAAAQELVKAGANKRLRDINGLSACDLAMEHGHDELVDLFIRQ